MHQGGARMGAVQNLEARRFEQHPVHAAGNTLRLAVAEDDDSGLRRRVVGQGERRLPEDRKAQAQQRRRKPPKSGTPTAISHGFLPRLINRLASDS